MKKRLFFIVALSFLLMVCSASVCLGLSREANTRGDVLQVSTERLLPATGAIQEEDTLHIIPADEIDWTEIIIQAAIDGNTYSGTGAEEQMIASGMDNGLRYNDLVDLAKIMSEEDGINWPDWAIMALGEVVLNRVSSPEFPDTIDAVLHQTNPTQYAPVQFDSWDAIKPGERYIRLAARLLLGERVLNNKQIVYQALFEQGRETVLSYKDLALGSTTYFCTTLNPELYE